jgi:hypothetical protein
MTEQASSRTTLSSLVVKTIVVHTVTYFIAGVLAYTINDYQTAYAKPPLSYFMRPTTDRIVMAGALFQPIRGIIFASVFYPFRNVLFAERRGWLILWWLLLALGVLSTFGPASGSVEGLIYTIIPWRSQLLGLWEVLLQSFLFSAILFYWVDHSRRRWLDWTLGAAFSIVVILAVLGLLVTPS